MRFTVAILLTVAAAATRAASYGPAPSTCCPNGGGKDLCTGRTGNKFNGTCCSDGSWECIVQGAAKGPCELKGVTGGQECPAPAPKCCPHGGGIGFCTGRTGNKFNGTCCSDGNWKCIIQGAAKGPCELEGLTGSTECPAPLPTGKCCKPRATQKMCTVGGYGSAKVPAPCCADGKFRCSGCADYNGVSNTCKCCPVADKPASCPTIGYGSQQGNIFCCNDGKWRCGATSKVCKPYQGKGKKCPSTPVVY